MNDYIGLELDNLPSVGQINTVLCVLVCNFIDVPFIVNLELDIN